VLKLKGMVAPSFIRPRLRGWGFSVVESLVRSINQYLKSNDLAFEVLDEFKIDVYKIRGLVGTLLSSDGTQQIQQRIALANAQKNFQSAITMDAEDDYIQKQLSFSGLAEIMREIRMQIASDLRMPLTKIFGISAAGFNAGEDDIENYNGMVESEIRTKCKYDILRVVELICLKEFGFLPDDLSIEFEPLRILSAEQHENVRNAKFSRLMQALTAGMITAEEFKMAANKDDLLGIKLNLETDSLALEEGDMAKEPAPDQEEIGASRMDTQSYITGTVEERSEEP
jgi:phage-related protein (TIGR01555 family)